MYIHAYPNDRVYIDISLICDYATWRFQTTGVKGATIQADVSGINTFLHFYGYGLNLRHGNSDPLIRLCRGIDRVRAIYDIGRQSVYRRALCMYMLNAMLKYLPLSDSFTRTLRGVILYGHESGFRSHNFIYTSKLDFGRMKNILIYPNTEDVTHLLIQLPHGKTHQVDSAEGESRILKCRCEFGDLCAVHEVTALIKDRYNSGKCGDEPIFQFEDGTPVSYYDLKETLEKLCILFDLDPRHYTPHCLRIGCATDMHLLGHTLPEIMKFMGWTSRKSAMKYIRPNNPDFVYFNML